MNTSLDLRDEGPPFLPNHLPTKPRRQYRPPIHRGARRATSEPASAGVCARRHTKKIPSWSTRSNQKSANVTEVTDALAAVCQLSDEIDPPIRLANGDRMPPPGAMFAGANGLLDLTMVAPASRTQPDILRSQAMAVAMRPKAARQHAAGAAGRSRSSVRPRWRPRPPSDVARANERGGQAAAFGVQY